MRFRTRAFLLCFVPFALMLTVSSWTVQRLVQSTVRQGLRTSLRDNHRAMGRVLAKSDLQNSRFLKVAGENAALKAGLQLALFDRKNPAGRATVEDQLRELSEHMGFDLLLVAAPDGRPLAGVKRERGQLAPLDLAHTGSWALRGLMELDGRAVQIASVPIDQGEENLGSLFIGEYFAFAGFTTPAVLMHNGRVLQSSIPGARIGEVQAAFASCAGQSECEVRLNGIGWISLPMEGGFFGGGYTVRTLQNVDAAAAPVQLVLRKVFAGVLTGGVIMALLCSFAAARSIVQPMAGFVAHLRSAGRTGLLVEFDAGNSGIREIQELAGSFNRAAVSVRESQDSLQRAYVEFVGSLASALDARDRYTSGHSERVSDLSCSTAAALDLDPGEIERIRIGALLHDIGKIGVADSVLQKPGRLTREEFALIKEHPQTGCRILEGVQGLASYLPAVELHHENWDGSGYPYGQAGEATPIEARIIHVSDAYDAMTTDRPYRAGMTHEEAIRILKMNAGTQFDPRVVAAFLTTAVESLAPQGELAAI
jgi:HD-GYP domain-containing protein (c-di-GMP phosphodiesterase class II)